MGDHEKIDLMAQALFDHNPGTPELVDAIQKASKTLGLEPQDAMVGRVLAAASSIAGMQNAAKSASQLLGKGSVAKQLSTRAEDFRGMAAVLRLSADTLDEVLREYVPEGSVQ